MEGKWRGDDEGHSSGEIELRTVCSVSLQLLEH